MKAIHYRILLEEQSDVLENVIIRKRGVRKTKLYGATTDFGFKR